MAGPPKLLGSTSLYCLYRRLATNGMRTRGSPNGIPLSPWASRLWRPAGVWGVPQKRHGAGGWARKHQGIDNPPIPVLSSRT